MLKSVPAPAAMTVPAESWVLLANGEQTLVLALDRGAWKLLACDAWAVRDLFESRPGDFALDVVTLLHPDDATDHGATTLLRALAGAADRFTLELASGPGETAEIAEFLHSTFGSDPTLH